MLSKLGNQQFMSFHSSKSRRIIKEKDPNCKGSHTSDPKDGTPMVVLRTYAHHETCVLAIVLPGSRWVKHKTREGAIDIIPPSAEFDWRKPGCSICLAMYPEQVRVKGVMH
jgi:homoaconitase/3-isopropylmalate dehydratase large subunit